MFSTFFLGTLYLERILHYSALPTGFAFLPFTVTVGMLSLGVTARLIARFGALRVLVGGLTTMVAGLLLLTTTGLHTAFFPTIFIAFFVLGLGAGSSFTPLLTIAMADVPPHDAGLGSGIVNLSQQVGGALGLAVLGTVATNHSKALEAHGQAVASSLLSGYHLAFRVGAGSLAVGIVLTLVVLRPHVRRGAERAADAQAAAEGAAAAQAAAPSPPARLRDSELEPALERQAA